MKDRAAIEELLRSLMDELRLRYHVKKIGIFGSYATGTQTERSDLDLIVEFERPIGLMAFVHLRALIAERLGVPVDMITPDGLHPLIRDDVMKSVVYVGETTSA